MRQQQRPALAGLCLLLAAAAWCSAPAAAAGSGATAEDFAWELTRGAFPWTQQRVRWNHTVTHGADTFPEYQENEKKYTDASGWIDEAFVVFGTSNYMPQLELILQAFQMFSTRPVIVYEIHGGDLPSLFPASKHPHLIGRRLHASRQLHIWFCKIQAALVSRVRYAAIAEADSMPTPIVDSVFGMVRRADVDHPIMPRHPYTPDAVKRQLGGMVRCVNEGPPASMHWGHAHIAWSYRALPFFAHMYGVMLAHPHLHPSDEAAMNCFLWQKAATVQACAFDINWEAFQELMIVGAGGPSWYPPSYPPADWGAYGHKESGPVAAYFVHAVKSQEQIKASFEVLRDHKTKVVGWYVYDGKYYDNTTAMVAASKDECVL